MKNFEPNRAFNTEVAAALGIYQAIFDSTNSLLAREVNT